MCTPNLPKFHKILAKVDVARFVRKLSVCVFESSASCFENLYISEKKVSKRIIYTLINQYIYIYIYVRLRMYVIDSLNTVASTFDKILRLHRDTPAEFRYSGTFPSVRILSVKLTQVVRTKLGKRTLPNLKSS